MGTTRTALPALAAVALLAGCATGTAGTPARTVTVTVAPSPSEGELRGAEADSEDLVGGRSHDLGTIAGKLGEGDDQVLLLDRWSASGFTDARLAKEGFPAQPVPHDRFHNSTDEKLYKVPLAEDLRVRVTTCEPSRDPAIKPGIRSRPVSLEEFLRLPDLPRQVALLSYDKGRLVTLETSPRCPAPAPPPATTPATTPAPPATPTPGRAGVPSSVPVLP